jgi:hypothetical protein
MGGSRGAGVLVSVLSRGRLLHCAHSPWAQLEEAAAVLRKALQRKRAEEGAEEGAGRGGAGAAGRVVLALPATAADEGLAALLSVPSGGEEGAGGVAVRRVGSDAVMRAGVAFASQAAFRSKCTFLDCPWA